MTSPTEFKVSADTYAAMVAAMTWYNTMPDSIKDAVGDRFHENFRDWQDRMTPDVFDESTHYVSHYEMIDGVPHVVLGTHDGGGDDEDLVAHPFIIE